MSQMIINSLRYALLKEGGNRWWTLHFNPRFFKLVLYYILFILIIALVTGIVSGASGFVADLHTMNTTPGIARRTYILARYILAGGGILVALGAIYLTIRLSLYSLFIATDQKRPFRSSWHLLKKNVWRFLGIIVLVILAVYIPSFALTYLVKMISTNHFITITTTIISSLFFTPLMMAVMSKAGALVYQTLEKGKTLK